MDVKFNDWLNTIILKEKPSNDIVAYYFGIIETTNGFEVYLTGSKIFDEEDEDWACNVDFVPKDKYYKIEYETDEWEFVLKLVQQMLEGYVQTKDFAGSFLENSIAIAYGFDGGDLYRIK